MDNVKRKTISCTIRMKGIQAITMYQDWVCANPQLTSEIESSVKWISYFLAGKVSDSTVLSELVYSISNLWVLLNDKILLNAQNRTSNTSNDNRVSLKTWLTVLEYSEVFIEITARQVWGTRAKWMVIALIHLCKCALRLCLVIRYRENILQCPPISPLERKKFSEENLNNDIEFHRTNTPHTSSDQGYSTASDEGFSIKSGRVIRTVNSATVSSRSWRPPSSASMEKIWEESNEHRLTESQRYGEALFIVKPLVHLGSMYFCGQKAWAPWLLSVMMDVSSLSLLNSTKDNEGRKITLWSKRQQFELHRRKMLLLLYLLRSPFYDRYSKERLNKLLLALSSSVPLVGHVLRPLAEYLPHWQDTHLYLWSS